MDNINIIISGPTNSGKSSVLYLIKTILKEQKFTVIGDGGIDFVDEVTFDEHAQRGINSKLDAIKKTTAITITEKSGSSDITSPWIKLSEGKPQVNQKCWVCDEDDNVIFCKYVSYRKHIFTKKTNFGFLDLLYVGSNSFPLIQRPIKWQLVKMPKP